MTTPGWLWQLALALWVLLLTTAVLPNTFPAGWSASMFGLLWFGLVYLVSLSGSFFALCATARGRFFQGFLTKQL